MLMNEKSTPFGGWLVNASVGLTEQDNIELSIAFPKDRLSDVETLQGHKIKFYAFPSVKGRSLSSIETNKYLEKIIDEVKPDLVHIFGTEYTHTLAMVNVCKKKSINAVISIQGLVSVISRHYMAYLPSRVQNRFTFRDIIKQDNLKQQKRKFVKRGRFEIEALQKVNHVIGRTTWDRACVLQINPRIQYHYCNESLRDEFYKYAWDINECERNSIFISQGSYPIKGLHMILEAMTLVLKKYPNTKLYIAGADITKFDTLIEKLKISSFGKYIRKLIKENNLQDHVIFTGILDEKQMCQRFLKSNVFVSASVIENESNSLSEAKILGLPCVASFVGGVINRLTDKEDGFFYQTDAPYMLAHYICEIFGNENLALEFSKNARKHAMKTHDRLENTNTMINIYKKIING